MSNRLSEGENLLEVKGFDSRQHLAQFILLCTIAFLTAATSISTSILSEVLWRNRLNWEEIGVVMAIYGFPVIVCSFFAGTVIATVGAVPLLRASIALVGVAVLSFEITANNYVLSVISRVAQGVGYAFFMISVLTSAKSTLNKDRFIYLFGVFSSMIPLPFVFVPGVAEAYLRVYGVSGLFASFALLAAVAFGLSFRMPIHDIRVSGATNLDVTFRVMRAKANLPTFLTIAVVGIFFGFLPSFMAHYQIANGVHAAYFFTSFGIVLFGYRFVLASKTSALPVRLLVPVALTAMSLALGLAGAWPNTGVAIVSGSLFGLGHSIAYPILSAEISERHSMEERPHVVAAFNTAFNIGILSSPLLVVALAQLFGFGVVLLGAAFLALLVAGLFYQFSQRVSSPA